MAQAKRGAKSKVDKGGSPHPGVFEGVFFLFAALAFYILLALASYNPADSAWSHSSGVGPVTNAGGVIGAWIADILLYLFGYLAALFPLILVYGAWWLWSKRALPLKPELAELGLRGAGFLLTLVAGSGVSALRFGAWAEALPMSAGGVLGRELGVLLVAWLSPTGAMLFLMALFLSGVTLLTRLSWLRLMDWLGARAVRLGERIGVVFLHTRDWLEGRRERAKRKQSADRFDAGGGRKRTPRIEPVAQPAPPVVRTVEQRQIPMFEAAGGAGLPSLSLLDKGAGDNVAAAPEVLEAISRRVELKFAEFGVEVQVVAVRPGPVVTRYEMETAPGVKVSQIVGLVKDISRALSVVSVRVVENIPGSSLIGLEIPNERRETVRFSDLMCSDVYRDSKSDLTLALGKDTEGTPAVADLARMPHLLVAGTTGSGKSVAINAMILSLLYKAGPEDVRLIMIDPKMLELSVYAGIPHLLAPVVTDMSDAGRALNWCVAEMDRRYRLMSALGVRNLAGFNRKVKEAAASGEPISDPFQPVENLDPENPEPPLTLSTLPHIVVVVDELADMMMLVGKKVEQLIARLAQKARASGIHLILATQRPSVDVLTGLIKANIPSRIAFQVSSKIDSRTILDQMGAEQLLGHGDMLFMPPGVGLPTRIHGAFVSDEEVHRVVEELRKQPPPVFQVDVFEEEAEAAMDGSAEGGGKSEDELYDRALALVTRTRKASISSVQRHLRIGYNRAARLVEDMEAQGVLSSVNESGAREVLAPPPPGD